MSSVSPPSVLYKFMPASYDGGKILLPVLKSGHIRFTQPEGMNDPYELRGGYRDNTDYKKYFREKYRPEILAKIRKAQIRGKQSNVSMGEMVKALNVIENSDLRSGELAKEIEKRLYYRRQNYGILSLAANCTSSAMWSQYAEAHTGICVGFDTQMPLFHRHRSEGMLALREVVYSEKRVPITLDDSSAPLPNDLFFRKSTDWAYEVEWRVVARFSDLPENSFRRNGLCRGIQVFTLPIDMNYITEIIVGARAHKSVEEAALEFSRSAKKPIHIFRMQLSEAHFQMEKEGPL